MFRKKIKNSLGLDISDNNLKICQLAKNGNKIVIQALGKYQLKPNVVENGEIKNKDEFINALKILLSKPKFGKITCREITVCLPEIKSYIKMIEIDKTPNKIADIIIPEIEKYIPAPIEEIYFDWQKIGENSEKMQILIGACPKIIVENYLSCLEASKLTTTALEIETIPIARSLLPEESGKKPESDNYIIIDLGAKRSSMIFYSRGIIIFTLSIPLSGDSITEQISKTLEIDLNQAEKAKIICGLDKDKAKGIINNLLSEMINDLINKIKEGVSHYNNYFSDYGIITKIILCGGGAYIKGIDKIIENSIGIETLPGNALDKLDNKSPNIFDIFMEKHSYKPNASKNFQEAGQMLSLSQESSLSYTTVIGLALRNFLVN
jgi:type IV pilus assembly protein PilM